MEKFKWIDFDPVAYGKVKPKGIIYKDSFCENESKFCQMGVPCGGGDIDRYCYTTPGGICPDAHLCTGPEHHCG